MKNALLLLIAFTLTSNSSLASYEDSEVTSSVEENTMSHNGPRLCEDSNLTIQECESTIRRQKESLDEQRADTKFLYGYCLSTMGQKGMNTYQAESTCAYLL